MSSLNQPLLSKGTIALAARQEDDIEDDILVEDVRGLLLRDHLADCTQSYVRYTAMSMWHAC